MDGAGGDGRVSDWASARREEGLPLLVEKFKTNLRRRFRRGAAGADSGGFAGSGRLESMPVNEYVDLYLPMRARSRLFGETLLSTERSTGR
jgi:hypothetical protein